MLFRSTQDNVDKMIDGMRSQAQMAQDKIAATDQSSGGANEQPNAPIPAAPANVNPQAWTQVIGTPPASQDGTPFPRPAWAAAVNLLLANPTPENIQLFNNSKFGKAGYEGSEIIKQLHTDAGEKPPPVKVLSKEDRQNGAILPNSIGHVR